MDSILRIILYRSTTIKIILGRSLKHVSNEKYCTNTFNTTQMQLYRYVETIIAKTTGCYITCDP